MLMLRVKYFKCWVDLWVNCNLGPFISLMIFQLLVISNVGIVIMKLPTIFVHLFVFFTIIISLAREFVILFVLVHTYLRLLFLLGRISLCSYMISLPVNGIFFAYKILFTWYLYSSPASFCLMFALCILSLCCTLSTSALFSLKYFLLIM